MRSSRKCRHVDSGVVYSSAKQMSVDLNLSIHKVYHILNGRVEDSIGIEYIEDRLVGINVLEAECNHCGIVKSREDFGVDKRSGNIKCYTCKKCRVNKERERRVSKPKGWHRVRRIMHTYKVSLEEAERLYLIKKCECCKIDLNENEKNNRKANGHVIDHNHETGEVRGVLCSGCNLALGHAREDVGVLNNLIKYINKTNKL